MEEKGKKGTEIPENLVKEAIEYTGCLSELIPVEKFFSGENK